jgi:hypothetical protein
MTLDALEFSRRLLQHVLPGGFQKVRHYGFLGPQSRISVEAIRWLITLRNGQQFLLLAQSPAPTTVARGPRCAECGGPLRVIVQIPQRSPAIHDSS